MSERDSSKLPVVTQAVYGTGQFVDSLSATVVGQFLFIYLTAVCGLSGTLAGASVFVALVVDAVADPLVGSLSDNTQSRFGRRHLYMFLSLPLMFFGLGMLFSVPHGLTEWPLFLYATAMALILRIGLSFFVVPYFALGAELTDDYLVRSHVVTWRSFFGVFATMLPYALAIVFFHGNQLTRAPYVPLGWTSAAILTLFGAIAAFGTLSARGRLHQATVSEHPALRRFLRELPEVFRNRSFLILFSTVLIFFVAQGTAGVLSQHGGIYFWKLPTDVIQILGIVSALGLLVGIPVVALLGPRVEKKTMTLWSLGYICLSQAGMPLARIAGLLPDHGLPLYIALGISNIVVYAAVTILTVSFQSMMADAADEHELLFGARREGLYFAGTTFSAKAASGLGSLIAGAAMDLIHFPYAIAEKGGAALHIAPEIARNLGLVYGVGPAAATLICIVINARYRIDRQTHANIQRELTERRAAANSQSPEIVV